MSLINYELSNSKVARDFYYQLSLSVFLSLSLSLFISLCLCLSISLYLSPSASLENACSSKIGDIILAAAAPSLATTHLLYRSF
jgi:hypothetical protein